MWWPSGNLGLGLPILEIFQLVLKQNYPQLGQESILSLRNGGDLELPLVTVCPHETPLTEVLMEQAWGRMCEDLVWVGLGGRPSRDGHVTGRHIQWTAQRTGGDPPESSNA